MHPGPVIVSAALATAEMAGADGATLLTAIAAGLEAGCRVGNAVTPGHYAAGFHITATCGVFGAAVAAARVLRLDATRMAWAIAHAASQAAGIVEALGAATKSTGVGAAAQAGLHAALFARAGVAGPAEPLEGRFGFLKVFCAEPQPARITDGLGEAWELFRSAPKAWPVGVVLHPVVDACLALRARPGFDATTLRALLFRGHKLLRLRTDRPAVTTGREATVSIQHVAAAALLRGTVGPAELTDAAVADTAIRTLGALVRVEDDAGIAVEGVRLSARFAEGEDQVIEIACGRGLPDRPLTDEELADKARLLIGWGAPWCDAEAVIAAAWGADALPSLAPFSALLVPPG
jgi:2-methylcitrate dehydratase PrpD